MGRRISELKEKAETLAKKLALPVSFILFMYIFGEDQAIKDDKKPVVGKTVKAISSILSDDVYIYNTIYDAMNSKNEKKAFYDATYDRKVVAAYYELEGKILRVDADNKYQEQTILNKNGQIIGVLTEVIDGKKLEGFHRADDVKEKWQAQNENNGYQKIRK